MQEPNQKPENFGPDRWRMAYLAFDMGFVIALPIVIFGLLGKYLDGRLNSSPWLTLVGIILAITTTTVWLTKKLKEYIKK